MPQPVDAALVAELFDRHAAALALYAQQWTSQPDDCVQEALVELAGQPVAPANPVAWLYRLVRNRALNASRAARRRSTHEQAAFGVRSTTRVFDDASTRMELVDALEALDAAAREVVVLRVWGQLAWQEIAEVVGGSKSAAQRNYVQALDELRKLWEPQARESQSQESRRCPTN
jgi:RNA polymerase sigma-70 factor (ECF subfamily)